MSRIKFSNYYYQYFIEVLDSEDPEVSAGKEWHENNISIIHSNLSQFMDMEQTKSKEIGIEVLKIIALSMAKYKAIRVNNK